jgi:hypothetical protein
MPWGIGSFQQLKKLTKYSIILLVPEKHQGIPLLRGISPVDGTHAAEEDAFGQGNIQKWNQ